MGNMWKTERTFGKNLGKQVETHEICTGIHQPPHRRWSLTKSCRSWSIRWHSRTVTWQQSGETPMGQKWVKELNMHRYGPYGFLLLISANSIPRQKTWKLCSHHCKASTRKRRPLFCGQSPNIRRHLRRLLLHATFSRVMNQTCSRNKCKENISVLRSDL